MKISKQQLLHNILYSFYRTLVVIFVIALILFVYNTVANQIKGSDIEELGKGGIVREFFTCDGFIDIYRCNGMDFLKNLFGTLVFDTVVILYSIFFLSYNTIGAVIVFVLCLTYQLYKENKKELGTVEQEKLIIKKISKKAAVAALIAMVIIGTIFAFIILHIETKPNAYYVLDWLWSCCIAYAITFTCVYTKMFKRSKRTLPENIL